MGLLFFPSTFEGGLNRDVGVYWYSKNVPVIQSVAYCSYASALRDLCAASLYFYLLQTYLRDKMLNDYIHKKEQMGTVMKNIDEVIKLKR